MRLRVKIRTLLLVPVAIAVVLHYLDATSPVYRTSGAREEAIDFLIVDAKSGEAIVDALVEFRDADSPDNWPPPRVSVRTNSSGRARIVEVCKNSGIVTRFRRSYLIAAPDWLLVVRRAGYIPADGILLTDKIGRGRPSSEAAFPVARIELTPVDTTERQEPIRLPESSETR